MGNIPASLRPHKPNSRLEEGGEVEDDGNAGTDSAVVVVVVDEMRQDEIGETDGGRATDSESRSDLGDSFEDLEKQLIVEPTDEEDCTEDAQPTVSQLIYPTMYAVETNASGKSIPGDPNDTASTSSIDEGPTFSPETAVPERRQTLPCKPTFVKSEDRARSKSTQLTHLTQWYVSLASVKQDAATQWSRPSSSKESRQVSTQTEAPDQPEPEEPRRRSCPAYVQHKSATTFRSKLSSLPLVETDRLRESTSESSSTTLTEADTLSSGDDLDGDDSSQTVDGRSVESSVSSCTTQARERRGPRPVEEADDCYLVTPLVDEKGDRRRASTNRNRHCAVRLAGRASCGGRLGGDSEVGRGDWQNLSSSLANPVALRSQEDFDDARVTAGSSRDGLRLPTNKRWCRHNHRCCPCCRKAACETSTESR